MARRNESKFSVAALALLLLVVLYGCRAFNPEPVIVNNPPDTFVTGAPAETTGTVFNRHMYWYGNDVDGAVVQFIFAITDSTVNDPSNPDVDEEDARFDPADDILTLTPTDWRTVGYTEKTDSVFVFTIDRLSNTSKDITFHIVAIDDRGAIDPTPARLHFFNNSLGNPVIRFHVTTFNDDGTEVDRWVGTVADGPKLQGDVIWPWAPDPATISPEDTDVPFIGFLNRFRICWEASSPNGAVVGYRYNVSESPSSDLVPTKIDEETGQEVPDWTLEDTCFDFENRINPDDLDPNNLPPECVSGWRDCPELRRWEAGKHKIQVLALDEALVQNGTQDGELRYAVNYPPETELIVNGEWPRYSVDGVNWISFSDGDTVPDGAYVLFKQYGVDRFERNRGNPLLQGLPCCDVPFSNADPDSEVRYQVRVADARAVNDQGGVNYWSTSYSPAEYGDTLGFHVGPFDYTVSFRSQDEHLTEDTTPAEIHFTGGFPPHISSVSPGEGDSLIIRFYKYGEWPENEVPYSSNSDIPPASGLHRYWDGTKYVFAAERDPSWPPQPNNGIPGTIIRYRVLFEGEPDVRDPNAAILSWTYTIFGEYDPKNRIKEGGGRDVFGKYSSPGTPDVWEMSVDDDGVEIFVPEWIWHDPDRDQWEPYAGMAKLLARQLGHIHMKVAGKTVQLGEEFAYCFLTVRESCGANASRIQLGALGRRTAEVEADFHAYLGLDPDDTGQITQFWPPEGYIPDEDLKK